MGVPVLASMAMGEYFNVAWNGNIYRYLLGLHIVWMVNSVAHLWGPKPYDKFVWRYSKFSIHDDKTLSAGIFLRPTRISWVSARLARDGTIITWVPNAGCLKFKFNVWNQNNHFNFFLDFSTSSRKLQLTCFLISLSRGVVCFDPEILATSIVNCRSKHGINPI